MLSKGLLGKLVRKSRVLFTVGALAGSIYGCDDVIQPNPKPTANFTVSHKDGYAPLNVCFNGSLSTAPGSSIAKYIWRFENGSVDSTSGVNVCHTYQNPGNDSAGLTVEDAKGERSTQKLEQIIRRDGSPVINIANISFNEGGADTLNLNGLISSPLYPASALTINATSPDLSVELNNIQLVVTAKDHLTVLAKDWNGSSYIDLTVTDPDSRQPTSRIPVSVCAQTDI